MPFYRFASTDKFVNTVVTYPSIEFAIIFNPNPSPAASRAKTYYNQQVSLTGNFNADTLVKHVPPGHLSFYEYNIDRPTGSFGSIPSGMALGTAQYISSSGLIYPWTVKDSTRIAFKSVTNQTYGQFNPGDVISGSYPMSASISKYLYLASHRRHRPTQTVGPGTADYLNYPSDIRATASVSYLHSLKNIMEGYRYLNPHYAVSSSYLGGGRDLTASTADNGKGAIDVGLLSIPSIFYGSQIKKGTVKLQFYVTGTLIGELRDTYKNGVLIQSSGAIAANDGQIAGTVLYNEGIIILTGSWNLLNDHTEEYTGWGGSGVAPKWIYFANTMRTPTQQYPLQAAVGTPSSSYAIHMSGTNKTQTITLLANAKKSELNHSNNPSYLTYGSLGASSSAHEQSYKELNTKSIKNVVSSSYNDPTGSFKKTTYISKIGIYDKYKNLIAIAKVATPVKKTEDRDFTFKLKLDI